MFGSGLNIALLEQAVRDGRPDVVDVAHEVGACAAQLGVPLHEVLDHVERAHGDDEPSFVTTRAAVLAWAEQALLHRAGISCEDPLTSLATLPHLRARLAEAYRDAERADRMADLGVLVVVELPRSLGGHELELSLRALDVAEAMRAVYTGGEIIAQVSPRRFAALVGREHTDALTMRLVAMLLERAMGPDVQARLWVEHLPASADGVSRVLAGLSE